MQLERVKESWTDNFENMPNQDWFTGKDIEENEKVSDTLDVKEDLSCKEELVTILKGLRNNKATDADYVVNEFLKYDSSEAGNKTLKIMDTIF